MKKNLDVLMKEFYSSEVFSKVSPPMPLRRRTKRRTGENIIVAACVIGCLFWLSQPSLYTNTLRRAVTSRSTYEMLKEDFSRVIFDASQEYKSSKGVKYD